jgi:hypothetical protein
MTGGSKLTLKQRLEYAWGKRRPDPEKGTELTADGIEVRTPSRSEFLGNLEKAAKPKQPEQG